MMGKLARIWIGATRLELSDELSYRFNFILKTITHTLTSAIIPLITLLVYTVSSGIPGWSLEEFLLLNGSFMFIGGLGSTLFQSMTWRTIDKIWHGRYDMDLIRPVRPLVLATLNTFNPDGLAYIFVGASIMAVSLVKMHWVFNAISTLSFVLLVGLALLFFYSIDIITIALSFLFVKTFALANAVEEIINIGKYPLSIYGSTGMVLFTFLFPVGLAGFYPAQALLGKLSFLMIGKLALVAFAFFGFSLLLWSVWMKKYSSAGG